MKPDSNTEPEEDFWELGDEEELPLVTDSTPEDKPVKSEESEADSEEGDSEEPAEEEPKNVSEEESEEESEEDAEDEATEVAPEEGSSKIPILGSLTQISILEKISLLAVLVILIGAASWGISTFYKNAPEGKLIDFTEDFPVEGAHAGIAEIETYWRKPVRTGENADHGVQLNAAIIPCARIVLHGSGSASLGISFRNGEQLIGDPHSLEVKGGKFVQTGSPEIIITSTAGFENLSEINAYTNADIDPWSVLIVEGEPSTNPSYTQDDKKLAEVRIAAESRD